MKNYTEESTSTTLSPFEKSVQTFIDSSKTAFEEARENLETARYLEKYQWIGRYIHSKKIFHLSDFYDYLVEKKEDHIDNAIPYTKFPTKKTIGRFLFELAKLRLLHYKAIPSNYLYNYDVYWVPYINPDYKKNAIEIYFQKYKEPKNKQKEKKSREEKIITNIQSRIDNYTSKTVAEKILEPLKQQEKELDLELKAENQKIYLEKQQEKVRELQKETDTEKVFTKALSKEKQRKASKIVKNVLLQQQKEQTTEERTAQNEEILSAMERIGIAIPNEKLLALEQKKEKLQLAAKKKKDNLQLPEESFSDPSDYSEVSEEIVTEEVV